MTDATHQAHSFDQSGGYEQARERLRVFAHEVEAELWKRDHDEAMRCLSFEQTLSYGVAVFDLIIKLDEVGSEAVLEEDAAMVESFHASIRALLKWWLQPCAFIESELEAFELKGYHVEAGADFRARHEEAKWILKDDALKFADPAFSELRDAAIDELRETS